MLSCSIRYNIPRGTIAHRIRNSIIKSYVSKNSVNSRFSTNAIVDVDNYAEFCDLKVVSSPFPPIPQPPYKTPLSEFISAEWTNPDLSTKVAILDGSTEESRTFSEYNAITKNVAASLYDLGVKEGKTVAFYCPNHVDYVPIVLAVTMCGAKVIPINPVYTKFELEKILGRSHVDVIISHGSIMDNMLDLLADKNGAGDWNHNVPVIVIPDSGSVVPEGTISLSDLKHHSKPLLQTIPCSHGDISSHIAVLPFSSGTTGLPKGVCLSHDNIIANLYQIEEIERFSFPSNHKLISPLPFFHIYAFTVSALYTAWKGQQLITSSSKFQLENFCKLVEEHRPQRAHLVPPILLGLGNNPVVDKYDMSSLKYALSAAAPLSKEVEESVLKRTGIQIKQVWGMSELSPIGTYTSDFNIKPGSVGPPVSDTFCKIVDVTTGKSLGPYEKGELLIKGPQVMLGYLDNPKATAENISSTGWLKTGDLAYYDEDGFFYMADRLKELIKVNGLPVAPAELEALLLTHDKIIDTAVIPVKCEQRGEVPKAFVVLNPLEKNTVSESDIQSWVKERVANYKQLGGGVEFVDVIPKTASGKILRRILRDREQQK